jgi:hypothetical protein
MSDKYDVIDGLILDSIGDAPKTFAELFRAEIFQECKRLAKEASKSGRSPFGVEGFRILDRRLQALRKAGKIISTGKGWVRT